MFSQVSTASTLSISAVKYVWKAMSVIVSHLYLTSYTQEKEQLHFSSLVKPNPNVHS